MCERLKSAAMHEKNRRNGNVTSNCVYGRIRRIFTELKVCITRQISSCSCCMPPVPGALREMKRRDAITCTLYNPSMKILGIETSCDETAAAVVKDGQTVLSNVIATSKKAFER